MPERAGHRQRDPDDYYATHPELCELACWTLRSDFIAAPETILEPTTVLEPSCGSGSWMPAIEATWPDASLLGVEKNPHLAAYAKQRGFTVEQRDLLAGELGTYDLVVGNPPFSLADDFIPMLLSRLNPGGVLAFMLRLNFFEGQDRYERFWRIFPAAAAYPLPARPGFTADGKTDGTGYMMCCWRKDYSGPTVLRHLDNRLVRNRWNGRPAIKRSGKVVREAVLDPAFPDPRHATSAARPVQLRARDLRDPGPTGVQPKS